MPANMKADNNNTRQYTYIFASCTLGHSHTPKGKRLKIRATVRQLIRLDKVPVSWVDVACGVLLFPDKAMFVSLDIT